VPDLGWFLSPRSTHDVMQHPIVAAAAEGDLPDWAVAGAPRLDHMERVSKLLGAWSEELTQDASETVRWRAAGFLHDLLRDEDPAVLRARVAPDARDLPDALLHGPAAAERLRVGGVEDGELLIAVAWHTIGDARFRGLGRALYVADFLEPGRAYLPEWRASLRARMPHELDHVVREVARARLTRGLEREAPILERTAAFWNRLVREEA
jgi:HD superfamily phosphohydrolase YqeK